MQNGKSPSAKSTGPAPPPTTIKLVQFQDIVRKCINSSEQLSTEYQTDPGTGYGGSANQTDRVVADDSACTIMDTPGWFGKAFDDDNQDVLNRVVQSSNGHSNGRSKKQQSKLTHLKGWYCEKVYYVCVLHYLLILSWACLSTRWT